jgi:hypothetical protein
MKRIQMRIRLQETLLQNVLSVLVVLGNVLGETINLTLVALDELAERSRISGSRAFNERKFVIVFRDHPPMIR